MTVIDQLIRGETKMVLVPAIIEIVEEMREYWPLTVRQLYYQLVSRLIIPNVLKHYQRASKVNASLRRHGLIPWAAFEDRSRRTIENRGKSGIQEFVSGQMESFLNPAYYGRCYVQNQDNYFQVAIEKDALSSIVSDAVWMYCARLNIVKGQASATIVNSMSERFKRAANIGQKPILLYLGDFDPTGIDIPESIQNKLLEFHVISVELVRVGLNEDQLKRFNLPESVDASKNSPQLSQVC